MTRLQKRLRPILCLVTLMSACTGSQKKSVVTTKAKTPEIRKLSVEKTPQRAQKISYEFKIRYELPKDVGARQHTSVDFSLCENRVSPKRKCYPPLKKPLAIRTKGVKSMFIPVHEKRIRVYMRPCYKAGALGRIPQEIALKGNERVCGSWTYQIVTLEDTKDGESSFLQIGLSENSP